jgi:hypothetical protein
MDFLTFPMARRRKAINRKVMRRNPNFSRKSPYKRRDTKIRRTLPVPDRAQRVLILPSSFEKDWMKRIKESRNISALTKSGRNPAPGLAKLPNGSLEDRKIVTAETTIQNRELRRSNRLIFLSSGRSGRYP